MSDFVPMTYPMCLVRSPWGEVQLSHTDGNLTLVLVVLNRTTYSQLQKHGLVGPRAEWKIRTPIDGLPTYPAMAPGWHIVGPSPIEPTINCPDVTVVYGLATPTSGRVAKQPTRLCDQ